jgi:type 2 lantibiotic (TIGR03893 family)
MNTKHINNLVGKSFEDLSINEMETLQGAGDVEVQTTPTIIWSVVSTVASGNLSAQVSKAISTLVTVAAGCKTD